MFVSIRSGFDGGKLEGLKRFESSTFRIIRVAYDSDESNKTTCVVQQDVISINRKLHGAFERIKCNARRSSVISRYYHIIVTTYSTYALTEVLM